MASGTPKADVANEQEETYNVAFCYLPFIVDGQTDTTEAYELALKALGGSDSWKQVEDKASYLLRYICEKYDPSFPDCQCHHFRLRGSNSLSLGIGKADSWRRVTLKDVVDGTPYCDFFISDVSCYAFSTSINILVYKLRFASSDPLVISTELSLLKKVRGTRIVPTARDRQGKIAEKALAKGEGVTLHELSELILSSAGLGESRSYFFYANEGRERMNVLMHVEAATGVDAKSTLFYLGNCYNKSFDYDGRHAIPTKMYWASPTTAWACSSEALACLTVPDCATSEQARKFVTGGFRYNFLTSYQFLYLMLLHQKYEYYRLLMSIGAGERRDRAQLEQFRRELEVFRANFVFSRVSETQQYQHLYDMVANELRLEEMDRDVGKPIEALRTLRREEEAGKRRQEEDAERESDRRIGNALNTFTMLAGISALFDGLELINNYVPLHVPEGVADWLSLALAVVLVVVMAKTANALRRN